jgi:uncharacterized protein (UPF0264 family)
VVNETTPNIMKIETTREEIVNYYTSKDFDIEINGTDEITINKWAREGEHEMPESDWDFVDGKDIYDKMSEEDQDEFTDFVNSLTV